MSMIPSNKSQSHPSRRRQFCRQLEPWRTSREAPILPRSKADLLSKDAACTTRKLPKLPSRSSPFAEPRSKWSWHDFANSTHEPTTTSSSRFGGATWPVRQLTPRAIRLRATRPKSSTRLFVCQSRGSQTREVSGLYLLREAVPGVLRILLCINPAELDDWRNTHYRCCYACATCHSEDFVWYSECSALKPAKPGARGTITGERRNGFDRAAVADFDDDYDNTPRQWHVAVDKTAGTYATLYFDSVWGRREIPMDQEAGLPSQGPDCVDNSHPRVVLCARRSSRTDDDSYRDRSAIEMLLGNPCLTASVARDLARFDFESCL